MSTAPINLAPYAAAEKWIARLTLLLGVLAAISVSCFYETTGHGHLRRAILAWFNFRWLRQGADALTTAFTAARWPTQLQSPHRRLLQSSLPLRVDSPRRLCYF